MFTPVAHLAHRGARPRAHVIRPSVPFASRRIPVVRVGSPPKMFPWMFDGRRDGSRDATPPTLLKGGHHVKGGIHVRPAFALSGVSVVLRVRKYLQERFHTSEFLCHHQKITHESMRSIDRLITDRSA